MTVAGQVLLLVGGRGTRLGDLAREIPKPLMPIDGDRRFLDIQIDTFVRQGFRNVILVAGHLGEQVEARYAQGHPCRGASIRVVREPTPRGTAGALAEAAGLLDEAFLVANGDTFLDINLRAFERDAAALGLPAVLAALETEDAGRYGSLATQGPRVTGFREKDSGAAGRASINAGLYRMERAVLQRIDRLPASLEVDVFPRLAEEGRLGQVPVDGWFLDIGLPATLATARSELPTRLRRPAVFFDRDNTLVVDRGYTHRPEDLRWIDGAIETIRGLNDRGIRVVVVTNQAGVARGHYGEAEVAAFHAAMSRDLAEAGAFVDAFYYCPYHPEAVVERYRADHPNRKPKPGMILKALQDLAIDPAASLLVGDSPTDIEAAAAAGIPGLLFDGGNLGATLAPWIARRSAAATGPAPAASDTVVADSASS